MNERKQEKKGCISRHSSTQSFKDPGKAGLLSAHVSGEETETPRFQTCLVS